jgi:GNAT superfamily N-acetyltransferase
MPVRKGSPEDIAGCLAIVDGSPEFFNEQGRRDARGHFDQHPFFVLREGDTVLGFAVVARKYPRVAELVLAAVNPARRRQGVGREILEHVARVLKQEGVAILEVKTLAAEGRSKGYEATRAFYEKNGFLHVETVSPYPAWGPGNPCAIYIRAL